MCTLVSVLCKYRVLEVQQSVIQTCVLWYLYCASTVYQRGNRIQYKHMYSCICTVQVQCTGGAIQYNTNMCTLVSVLCEVQCTRGAIEYNTNMCTLISVLCEYGVLEGQQNTIQTCVLSYLYCASMVYQRGNRKQYKHVYSHICTVQVQCTRGSIELHTNMCTLISVLCEYGVLEGQQNTIQTYVLFIFVLCKYSVLVLEGQYNTIQTCVLSYLYCDKYSVLDGQQNTIQTCVLSYLYCASTVYQRGNRIQYKHVYSHICTVQVQCVGTIELHTNMCTLISVQLRVWCTRGAIEYNTNMCTLVSVLCKYRVLEGQQNTIQTCVLSYLYCVKYGVLEGQQNTIQTCVQFNRIHMYCTLYLYCATTVYQRGNRIYKHVLSYLYCVSMVYQRGNRIQYKHVYSHICTM